MVASGINDMIHLKKQVASFLLARLNPELSRAVSCVSIRYMCRPLSPSFSLSYEVKASSTTPAKLHVNINCPAVLTEGFANKCFADECALFLSSKCSSSNFSQVRPNWFFNSSLFTSGLRWVAQFRRFLDTPRSSFFRQLSRCRCFAITRAIHHGRAVILVKPLSSGSLATCFLMPWCRLEIYSLPMSSSHICLHIRLSSHSPFGV